MNSNFSVRKFSNSKDLYFLQFLLIFQYFIALIFLLKAYSVFPFKFVILSFNSFGLVYCQLDSFKAIYFIPKLSYAGTNSNLIFSNSITIVGEDCFIIEFEYQCSANPFNQLRQV